MTKPINRYKLTFVNAFNGYSETSDDKQKLIDYAVSKKSIFTPEALWEFNEKKDRWVKIGEFRKQQRNNIKELNMKTAKVKVFCPNCGATYTPELTQVKNEKKEIDGKLIFLKYFNCQVCNAQNYIQVDNNETLAQLELCKKQIRNQITANRKGKKGKQSGLAKKSQTHLRNNRKALQLMLKDKINFANYEVFEDEV